MPKHVVNNWSHYEHVVSKDMAHMHYPAAGSMADYTLRDTGGHIQSLLVGHVLDVEGFRSWQKADIMIRDNVPDFDQESTALKGDGQKGEKKSHIANFKKVILRPCSRHREEELGRGGAKRDAKKMVKNVYQAMMKSRSPKKVKELLQALKEVPHSGELQATKTN